MTAAAWHLAVAPDPALPPLFWLGRVDVSRREVEVRCGASVRCTQTGMFEGTWASPAAGDGTLDELPSATTVFGSGLVLTAAGPQVITPAHAISGVFTFVDGSGAASTTLIANSLVGLLAAADIELLPDTDYPALFLRSTAGIDNSPVTLPVSRGNLRFWFAWNLRLGSDGAITQVAKPVEAPFSSFADYRARLTSTLASVIANGAGYEPCVSLSSGYDSTAVAVLAAENGGRRAVTMSHGRRTGKSGPDTSDSGAATATRLGMRVDEFDRLAYLGRSDYPEAEFLATGMSGEDVVMSAYEPSLYRTLLLTGTQGNGAWRRGSSPRTDLSRLALDGASLNEFRLRVDFMFVPLPLFGMLQRPSIVAIGNQPEMRPWSVAGRYDQPISRRIAEEAGLPRGSFAVRKHAASALLHTFGEAAFSAATVAAVREFAAKEGRAASFSPRPGLPGWQRAAARVATVLRVSPVVDAINRRRRRLVHFESSLGNLLLRWSVDRIRPRYASVARKERWP